MMIRGLLFLATVALSQIDGTASFVTNSNRAISLSASLSPSSALFAKKKNKSQAGKGFGKEPEKVATPSKSNNADLFNIDARAAAASQRQPQAFTSVDGGSNAIPTMAAPDYSNETAEERNKRILREKYGLRTKEEQEAAEAKTKQIADQRKQISEWQKQADDGDDFDLLSIIPDPILIFIDKFLKVGVTVCTVLFVLAGFAISVEAGSRAFSKPLPQGIDDFISNIVEPNFTPGLGVLLSFSVALGLFASLQLNSAASTYREDK